MTKGTEWKCILFFALPLMGSTLLQTLYSFVDSVIVGNFVNATAFGAIGLLNPLIMLLNMFGTSFGTGVSIVVSQFFGANRKKDVQETAATGLLVAALLSLLLSAICLMVSRPIVAGFMQTPADMLDYSLIYLRIYAGGMFFQFLYNVSYGILRAHGDSRSAMLFLLVSAILNVALDCLFVIGFGWEVMGAALATVIAQAGACLASCGYLWHNFPHLSLIHRANWFCSRNKLGLIVKISVPILMQSSILSIGFIVLQRLVNSFGAPSIEGYAAMQKVESFIHIPANTLSTAMSSFTGQNMGAGRPDRVRRGYRVAAAMGLESCAVIAVILTVYDRELLSVFNIGQEALKRGAEHLDLLVIFMLFYAVSNITGGMLQGAGDVKVPAITSFVNLFIRVASSFLMAGTVVGYRCIFYSLPPAWTTAFLIHFIRYRSGAWERKALVADSSK